MKPKLHSDASILKPAKAVLRLEGRAVLALAGHLNARFAAAVKTIAACKGRVVVMGIGKSGLIGRKIAATLASTGTPATFVYPVECLHGDLGMIAAEDVALALSHSGATEELVKLVPLLKNRGLKIIAMTGNRHSRLAALSDIVVHIPISKEACPYNITPTASTTALLATGDALALALMKMKNFGKNDFASLHPGGTLGQALTTRVKDLMRTGKSNPVIREADTVKTALAAMTRTRMGATSVIDSKGRLCGFFTDGDLRRRIISGKLTVGTRISAVMTRSPLALTGEMLAADAARVLREKGIDNMPVLDSNKRPVGILDERDLLGIIPLETK